MESLSQIDVDRIQIAKESSQIGELKVFSFPFICETPMVIAKESSQIGELKVFVH